MLGASSMQPTNFAPQELTEGYIRSYNALHGEVPRVRHMNGPWFMVNGEILHQRTLSEEIMRLKTLSERRTPVERSIIHRLIARLKAI